MTGSGGASSTPRLLGSITDVSGILDHPPEPVIRPANGRTGWRVMTVGEQTQLRDLAAGLREVDPEFFAI
jgi:hypothetical protein